MDSINRRAFMATTGAAFLAASARSAHGENVTSQPNVLVIITDQQRAECLGAAGNPDVLTPSIDGLSKDGVLFENCFCPYPVCTPSRYSVISGMYVHEHQGWSNRCTLRPDIETFPKMLRAAGYKTKCVGKMHYTPTYLDVGFDEMELSEQNGMGRWDDDYHRALMAEGLVNASDIEDQERAYRKDAREEYWDYFGALPSNLPREWHTTQWTGDRSVDSIQRWDGGGNCLVTSFVKPHHPFEPPADMCDAYDPAKLELLPGWSDDVPDHNYALSKGYFDNKKLSIDALRHVMAYYYANISHIDEQVGRMVSLLKQKNLYDNTMIVFLSDHGEYLGHHHMLLKGNYAYDPLARVPLITKFPGQRRAGSRESGQVSLIDVAPTVMNACGIAPAASMHGLDLANEGAGREIAFLESHGGKIAMARTSDHKLIVDTRIDSSLLYDLKADPEEKRNLSASEDHREVAESLHGAIEDWRPLDVDGTPYLDYDAPEIDQPNVPDRAGDHRERIQAFTAKGMAEFYAKA